MQETNIAIKGVRDGLYVSVSEGEEWAVVITELAGRIDGQSAFFAGARITLDLGARPVRKDELGSIKAMLERRGLALYAVNSASQTSVDAATALDLRALLTGQPASSGGRPAATALPAFSSEEDGTLGVLIRRTLRSGRTVKTEGHAVVLGDVNGGASVVAGGDVIIWGRLRGNVHAGAYGDESAVVCALDMMPTQMRIAGFITVSPADKTHKPRPERAMIREGRIIVETWAEGRE